MNKKLLLNLSALTIATTPVIAIVSCSNSSSGQDVDSILNDGKLDGMSDNTYNQVNKYIFGTQDEYGQFPNNFQIQLENSLNNSENLKPMTEAEALKKAEDNLNNISDAQLEQMLNINLAKGFHKDEFTSLINNPSQPNLINLNFFNKFINTINSEINNKLRAQNLNISVSEKMVINGFISNVQFNKETKELSFNQNVTLAAKAILNFNGNSYTFEETLILNYQYKNLKIKSVASKYNNCLLPSLALDENQPNASINLSNYSINLPSFDVLERAARDIFNSLNLGNIVNTLISSVRKEYDKLVNLVKTILQNLKNIKIGTNNNKFEVDTNISNAEWGSFVNIYPPSPASNSSFGYLVDQNGNVTPQPFNFNCNILFAQMNETDHTAQWEVYKEQIN